MRTLLLYNPVSGRNNRRRPQLIASIATLLRAHDHQVTIEPTTAPGSAAQQAQTAIAHGAEVILACGGDGTVHDVLQGIVALAAAESLPILGVIPMGSANALARHLGLSTDPVAAARQLLTFVPRLIPIGEIQAAACTRYFAVMAGAGPSGALVYPGGATGPPIFPLPKHRLGRLAYYLRAALLFATHPFPAFEIRWTDISPDALPAATHVTTAIGAMAVRVNSLGGLFHPLAPAGAVYHPHLTIVAVHPPGWLGLPVWFAGSWLAGFWPGRRLRTPLVLRAEASEFTITPAPGSRPIHLQADGEWIGTAPAHIRLIPNAVRLLMPP